MKPFNGLVQEIMLDLSGRTAAWIVCLEGQPPAAGQYLVGWSPDDIDNPLPTPLFAGEISGNGFLAVPPLPVSWQPGIYIKLTGPLGRGFRLPGSARRMTLAAMGDTAARLMPLINTALERNCSTALFTDLPQPGLPTAVEISPLRYLPTALSWADFLALDLPAARLSSLRPVLGLPASLPLPCPAQALVTLAMPCAGLADCGACAVPVRRSGWKLACKEGPVFDLAGLDW